MFRSRSRTDSYPISVVSSHPGPFLLLLLHALTISNSQKYELREVDVHDNIPFVVIVPLETILRCCKFSIVVITSRGSCRKLFLFLSFEVHFLD